MKLTDEQLDTLRKAFRLSPRETQMIGLIFAGFTDNAELAGQMNLTVGSAQALLNHIYAKTRLSDRTKLVILCLDTLAPLYR